MLDIYESGGPPLRDQLIRLLQNWQQLGEYHHCS
jgi:hypothetical protein